MKGLELLEQLGFSPYSTWYVKSVHFPTPKSEVERLREENRKLLDEISDCRGRLEQVTFLTRVHRVTEHNKAVMYDTASERVLFDQDCGSQERRETLSTQYHRQANTALEHAQLLGQINEAATLPGSKQ